MSFLLHLAQTNYYPVFQTSPGTENYCPLFPSSPGTEQLLPCHSYLSWDRQIIALPFLQYLGHRNDCPVIPTLAGTDKLLPSSHFTGDTEIIDVIPDLAGTQKSSPSFLLHLGQTPFCLTIKDKQLIELSLVVLIGHRSHSLLFSTSAETNILLYYHYGTNSLLSCHFYMSWDITVYFTTINISTSANIFLLKIASAKTNILLS